MGHQKQGPIFLSTQHVQMSVPVKITEGWVQCLEPQLFKIAKVLVVQLECWM